MLDFYDQLGTWQRVALAAGLAVLGHLLVRLIRWGSGRATTSQIARSSSKALTLISLLTSIAVFVIYFTAFGFVMTEAGVPLSTYLASASIIGLAVAFGSQGIVQDVVSGVTIVFTDLFDVGDVVEISGQVGVVERFGMRFTVLRSPLGAEVFVPNRSILNVVAYPRGYVRCFVDVTLPQDADAAERMEDRVRVLSAAAEGQFAGIFRAPPEVMDPATTAAGRQFIRIKFRIWPGRGGPLETAFRQELVQAGKSIDPDYAEWMVMVNNEVETYRAPKRN
ncbi:MAG: mechanosensitive ion channel family protein [Minwuia sp.]|uniref:mechanosensitive ion channel family protein n=1 Tax=Minwuia sp. TaxID=2493630 RepID=UPI003A894F94